MAGDQDVCECGNTAGYFVSPTTNRRTKTGLCARCYEIAAFRYNQVNHSVLNKLEMAADRRRRGRTDMPNGGTGFNHVFEDAMVALPRA